MKPNRQLNINNMLIKYVQNEFQGACICVPTEGHQWGSKVQ
jgi:hypothetical protein